MNYKYSFDDIMIIPKELSFINSRKEVNVYDENGMLPIFTAPMLDVVSIENYKTFLKNKIYPIIPREKEYKNFLNNFSILGIDAKLVFVSCNLNQFETFINSELEYKLKMQINDGICILIDIANGHQRRLLKFVEKCKNKYDNKIKLMIGNIANPITYEFYTKLKVDYIRVGIANGSACETRLTGIGFPQASLIRETYEHKKLINPQFQTKIISDGGHKDIPDVIKALSLGADCVMLGGILNSKIESSGTLYYKSIKLSRKIGEFLFRKGFNIKKLYRGMSTTEVQEVIGNQGLRISEGIRKYNKINGSLITWCSDFVHYLQSCMSYCSTQNLKDFIGIPKIINITPSGYNRTQK